MNKQTQISKPHIEKGRELERVIELIEKTIFSVDHSFKDKDYSIERNKVIVINRVKYEIDIYVEFFKLGQKFIYIYECKNREKPVARKEITDFSDKIGVVSASKGFFIAKSFSKDSKNKANELKRIECIEVASTQYLNHAFSNFIFNDILKTKIEAAFGFKTKNKDKKKFPLPLDSKVNFNGSELQLNRFVEIELDKLINEFMKDKEIKLGEIYTYTLKKELKYKKGEVTINNLKVSKGEFEVEFKYSSLIPYRTLISHVPNRGKVVNFEVKQINDNILKLDIVIL